MFARALNLNQYSPLNMAVWCTLAFQAGSINAGGFLACSRFVTHTTGFATLFGTEFALGHFNTATGMLTVPIFFLIGAMISALFVDRQIVKGKLPRYNLVFGLIGFVLLLVCFLGGGGSFGVFGLLSGPNEIAGEFPMLALLCLASGMQNAAITSASGAVLRTTHLTGLTTDLGIGIVRVATHWMDQVNAEPEVRKNMIRVSIIVSFILGATFGAFLFYHVHYWGFLFPAILSLSLMSFGVYLDRRAVRLTNGPSSPQPKIS